MPLVGARHANQGYGPGEAEWKYEDDKDALFVVDVWAKDAPIDVQNVLERLAAVVDDCRILDD
jgi:hypothetical protein